MGEYRSSDDDYDYDYDYDYYDDDDEVDFVDDDENAAELEAAVEPEIPPNSCPSSKVITKESLLAAQMEDLIRVMDLLSLKEHHARTLLIHYRWDVEKVLAVLVEYGKERLFAKAGLTIVETDDVSSSQVSSSYCCNICFDDVSLEEITTMDCGHYFCNSCWTEHFIVKINEGQSRRITCMEHKCNAICDESKIRCLVRARDSDLADKFDRFMLESYIEDNKRVKWCPSVPHCGNAIRIEVDELREVECASTLINIPKSLNVSGPSWLCGAATGSDHTWTSIAGHSCGRYKEDREKETESAKRSLERYIHYYSRYEAHRDSSKLESKMKETMEDNIKILEECSTASSKDFVWLFNGVDRLFRSRRVLAYSYPFAYYMFDGDLFADEMTKGEREMKQNLFEDQQQQFEANIEKLSSFLDEKFHLYNEDEIKDLKLRVIALSATTDNLCRNLYECIETDLLGSLKHSVHEIAPYNTNGIEKASLPSYQDT
ncbi:putative E3 ubiquitin-protein ligase ARI2 [Citrus sinensis]|uniref:E3 ubiquitin-protein ligase ARI2 n=1 Tax=Citrus sinensis TaxID=2711 RepID=A0ACB8KVR5_CITSI|nr:putative E3 ubiquitin-protein ligase ARI2 [Citrus sinensis]